MLRTEGTVIDQFQLDRFVTPNPLTSHKMGPLLMEYIYIIEMPTILIGVITWNLNNVDYAKPRQIKNPTRVTFATLLCIDLHEVSYIYYNISMCVVGISCSNWPHLQVMCRQKHAYWTTPDQNMMHASTSSWEHNEWSYHSTVYDKGEKIYIVGPLNRKEKIEEGSSSGGVLNCTNVYMETLDRVRAIKDRKCK